MPNHNSRSLPFVAGLRPSPFGHNPKLLVIPNEREGSWLGRSCLPNTEITAPRSAEDVSSAVFLEWETACANKSSAYHLGSMRFAPPIQRLAAFLCLVLLLLAALTPSVASYTLAILVVLWSILPLSLFVQLADIPDDDPSHQSLAIAVLSPRAPPNR